ncbi:L-amino-acid oxidase [Apiospora kogelbergensis]|uniref:L-amino-acid oxidase n=1 Tax=Apiospora kogelbergensis TaxID=1337665 RepID=UPI00312F53BF
MRYSLAASLLVGSAACAPYAPLPVHLETRSEIDSRVTNVHLTFNEPVDGELTYTYGRHCTGTHQVRDAHHVVARSSDSNASRLVWLMPKDAESGGCLSAWNSEGVLVGRSEPQRFQTVKKRDLRKRSGVAMTQEMGIDTWGPWFDGVKLLESKALSTVDAAAAKSKEVAIVGGGMSGLMTYLVLSQSGMSNIKILEASQRLGGRVHTEYLSGGPFDYSYQEMGPMRFPKTVSVANETYNITDHELVFQLADEMNRLNNYDRNLSVDFIPWYQASSNGLSYNNGFKLDTGLPPTLAQIQQNSSLAAPAPVLDAATQELQDAITKITSNETMMIEIATNMHKAHKDFIVNGLGGKGGEVWSEFAYMVNYLNATLNQTDMVVGSSADSSFWNSLYDNVYFSATTWSTINGGLSRLPLSFHPLVDNITTMDAHIDKVEYLDEEQRVRLSWKQNKESTYQNATFDYAVIAMPFSKVKLWRLPMLPTSIKNAINNVPMASACKVALEYKTRFWEHLTSGPIYGSCSTSTDIPGVGSVCYPSYNINGTGPASIMASYASGDWAVRWLSKTEEEHVQYIADAMVEIHGEVAREQYTGNYNRRCWYLDPYEGGAWAAPTIGQHQLYIPEYFKTYSNMIFVGEQTSYTHAWIASALESGVRGAVQLLLELGLVDEAKAAVDKWMARWIEV